MPDDYEFPPFEEETPEETPTVKPITNSILLTIKKMLGIAEEYHAFDIDVITNINSVFLTLNQLGIGPRFPFQISDDSLTWDDFLGEQKEILQGVQTYVYLKVRLLFDPPTNSFLVDSMQKQCSEFEWRLNVQAEYPPEKELMPEPEPPVEETPATFSIRRTKATPKTPMDIFGQ